MRRLACAAAVLLAACGSSAPTPVNQQAGPSCEARTFNGPIVSAHRGGAAYAPENTLVAFRNAVRLRVDQLEMDTQLTSDGQLVIIHDDTLDRTTDCSGAINSKTLAQIEACDAAHWFSPDQGVTVPSMTVPHPLRGTGVKVPALRDLLAWYQALDCDRPDLSIEIKNIPGETNFDPAGDKTAKVLLPLLAEFGLEKEVIIQSFWPLTLDVVKSMNPRLRTQFLTTSSSGETAAANLAYVIARNHDITAPNFDAPDFIAPLVTAAHAAHKVVLPYTPDHYADQQKVLGLGADGLITNFPACMLQLLGRPVPARIAADGFPADTPACPDVVAPPPASMANRPSPEICAALRPARWSPAQGVASDNAKLRAVGIQYKQEVRHVETYDTFRTKMRCLMEDHVVPQMKPGLPMLVVFNEDIGLMTVAIGLRGALVREQAATPLRAPLGDQVPVGIAAALGELNAAYAPQVAAYQAMFPAIDPRKEIFVAATDTFARAFSQTFSDIARDYGVYVVASNNMPRYRASKEPADVLVFKDPELANVDEVYVATSAHVANTTFLWGPLDLHPEAPRGETNLLFRNEKVPLTDIEKTLIALDEGPATGDDAIANAAGYEVEGFRLGFATSLPAFTWGYDFGQMPPTEPCVDARVGYMACMNALGVDVVVQAEANPGRWAADAANGWQPLEWMNSTWRTVADPSARFRYNITPMLTGNLLDLPFDGQSAITMRGAHSAPAHYIGNLEFESGPDPARYQSYVGDKPEFLVLAPWVIPDASRTQLHDTGSKLSPGSGDALENDYLETAGWADLTR